MDYKAQLDIFFNEFHQFFDEQAPQVIADTAVQHFQERFIKKDWDGQPWPALSKAYKPSRGTMMLRSRALMASVRPGTVSPALVSIIAGSSKVPYARVHNEGETIHRMARSETFVRNRHTRGKLGKMFGGMGAFRKGTAPGRGLTFKAYDIKIPKRQFMGHSQQLEDNIRSRLTGLYNLK